MCHLDNSSYPCTYILAEIINQPRRYIDDHFNNIYSQIIDIHDSDYESDTEKTHKMFISKDKRREKIIIY